MNRLASLESNMEHKGLKPEPLHIEPSFLTDEDFFGIFWKVFTKDEPNNHLDDLKNWDIENENDGNLIRNL